MSFCFILRTGLIDSDVEIALFSGYNTARSTMRIKIVLHQSELPTVVKGSFTSIRFSLLRRSTTHGVFQRETVLSVQV